MNPWRLLLQPCVGALVILASAGGAFGQVVVPATPKKFATRTISGGGSTSSASVGVTAPKPQTTVRTTTYIALGDARQWRSTDGKSVLGKLIAFEDIVVETQSGSGAKPAPADQRAMPDNPTVVRDGKARLLIDNKPFEVPLERLSEDDRKLVASIRDAVAAKKTR